MKRAVIYARYSSDKQTEQSIEGQLYDCHRYAAAHELQVVHEYIDRAISGRTDDRPQFKQMLSDSAHGDWEYVLVWKFDRFSRNMYDSAIHKRTLQRNGVRVLSAMENVTPDKNGELMEHILESFADYYVADLQEKTRRGMYQTAMKCESTGHIPYGYKVVDKKYVINDAERYVPETVFRRYAAGDRLTDIARDLNERGYRTRKGKKFTCNSFYAMLSNEKYTGTYVYGDIRREGGMPAMVPVEIFEEVRRRLKDNKKRKARFRAKTDYLLSGKLFCGECEEPMSGYSGIGRNGVPHYYYRCNGVAKKSGCHKHNEKKEPLEAEVCRIARQAFADMDKRKTAEELHELYVHAVSVKSLPAVEQDVADTRKQISNLTMAIAESGGNKFIYDKLAELTERMEQLEAELDVTSRMADNVPSVEQLMVMIDDILAVDIDTPFGRKTLIDVMISKVYVYDDRLTIVFNDRGRTSKDISLAEIEKASADSELSAEGSQNKDILFVCDTLVCIGSRI